MQNPLRILREKLGVSKDEMATLLEIPIEVLTDLEKPRRRLSQELHDMVQALINRFEDKLH